MTVFNVYLDGERVVPIGPEYEWFKDKDGQDRHLVIMSEDHTEQLQPVIEWDS